MTKQKKNHETLHSINLQSIRCSYLLHRHTNRQILAHPLFCTHRIFSDLDNFALDFRQNKQRHRQDPFYYLSGLGCGRYLAGHQGQPTAHIENPAVCQHGHRDARSHRRSTGVAKRSTRSPYGFWRLGIHRRPHPVGPRFTPPERAGGTSSIASMK